MQDILELNKRLLHCGAEIIKLMNGTHSLPPRQKGVPKKERIKFFIKYWEFQYRLAEEVLNSYYDVIKSEEEEEEAIS